MRCELGTCQNEAFVECEWGLYEPRDEQPRTEPMNKATLCRQCSDQLWKRLRGAVGSGIMHWKNRVLNESALIPK